MYFPLRLHDERGKTPGSRLEAARRDRRVESKNPTSFLAQRGAMTCHDKIRPNGGELTEFP